MALITHHRYTAVPTAWIPDSINYVIVSGTEMETYVVDANGVARKDFGRSDAATLLADGIAAAGSVQEVANIAERDDLTPAGVVQVYVNDATADPTVVSGGAFYLYRPSTSTWKKTGEDESLDLILQWSSIDGRPASSPAAIDGAVNASHSHANLTQLGKLGEDADGCATYAGNLIGPNFATDQW